MPSIHDDEPQIPTEAYSTFAGITHVEFESHPYGPVPLFGFLRDRT
jgi:hypothetical protein